MALSARMALTARRWRGLHGLLVLCCASLAMPAFARSPRSLPTQVGASVAKPASVAAPASSSSATASTRVDEGFDWRAARGVLFRIHSPQAGAADSLLFGTIHIGTPAELGLDPQRVADAVQARHTLVNEVDGDTPWQSSYDRYRFLAPGQSLAQLIGGTEFIELGTLLPEHNGVQLNRFKPWVAMTLLEEGQDAPAASAGTAGEHSIDSVVEDIARRHGLKLVHLETLEDQLAALDCAPPSEYAVVLQQRLADPHELRAETERSLAFYRAGDLPGWLADIDAMHGLDPRAQGAERRARGCLIEQRNARWIEELEPLLRNGGCFVAVGAIHLTGKDGLLAGLARRGFAVSEQGWSGKLGIGNPAEGFPDGRGERAFDRELALSGTSQQQPLSAKKSPGAFSTTFPATVRKSPFGIPRFPFPALN